VLRKIFLFIFIILTLFDCKTINNKENKKNSNIKNELKQEKEIFFDFLGFDYSVSPEDSIAKNENIYQIKYNLNFKFKTTKKIILNYKIFDEENNLLLNKSNIETKQISKNEALVKDSFFDNFNYSTLKYSIQAYNDKKSIDLTGDFNNSNLPILEYIKLGPIITKNDNRKVNISFFTEVSIKNCRDLIWIRLIPPDESSFWIISTKQDSSGYVGNAVINENKNFIENGNYLIQINLGKLGFIQKSIEITDFFNNQKGPNYGLPTVEEISSDKNYLKLDINLLNKIENMEIWLFSEKNDQRSGIANFVSPEGNISKKDLFVMFKDDSKNSIKLKYNKKYYYRVYLYSKEINGMKYISISNLLPITFQGFNFFGL
jgi:hypothetical protein